MVRLTITIHILEHLDIPISPEPSVSNERKTCSQYLSVFPLGRNAL